MIAMTSLPPAPYGLTVSGFSPDDLAELVVLQRCCRVAEAIANNTLEIPALLEDATEVLAWAHLRLGEVSHVYPGNWLCARETSWAR
jgi:hypothetical protein